MLLHDAAVTSDCQRIFAVGTMAKSSDGLQPSKSRSEKQIISGCRSSDIHVEPSPLTLIIAVFNLDRKEIEKSVNSCCDVPRRFIDVLYAVAYLYCMRSGISRFHRATSSSSSAMRTM